MKLQSSKSQTNRYILNTKIFQTINIPEKKKGVGDIQQYLSALKKSIKLLDQSKSKEKLNQRNSMHPSKSVMIKNKSIEKEKDTLDIINNYNSNKSNRYNTNDESKIKNKSRLYKDKLSVLNKLLKNKNKKNNNTDINNINNNNTINNHALFNKNRYSQKLLRSLPKTKNSEIFMTSFDYSKEKKDDKGILKTELNEPNKISININKNNNRFSLPKIEPKSTRGMVLDERKTRNDRMKSHILRPNFSFDTKRIKDILNKNNENENEEKEKEKDIIIELNKKLISLFGYDHRHSTPTRPDIENFVKKLKSIKKIINRKSFEYELDKWIMRSKIKYVDWKFGINELEKYFTDVDEFGVKEKNELELRKSFYKKLNILIDNLKEEKEIKRIKEREKAYGIKAEKEEKKVIKNNEYWNDDKAINFMREQYQFLKKVKERKIREQKNRDIIQNILIKSRQRAYNINNS